MLGRALAAAVAAGGAATCSLRSAYCDDEVDQRRVGSSKYAPSYLDADTLERSAKAIRDIDRSPNAKAVYEHLKQQELSKQAETRKEEAELLAQAKQYEAATEQQRQEGESKRERERAQHNAQLMQQQRQIEAEKMQQQAEMTRRTNAEYLEQQKRISLEVEEAKRRTAAQLEAERKATMQFETEQQTKLAVERAMAEGRARALEHRENRDIFLEEISKQASEWGRQYMLLLNEALVRLGTGAQLLLTTDAGPRALAGAAGLFAAYYGIRGGFALSYRQLERWLSTPSLVRETSRNNVLQRARAALGLAAPVYLPRDAALAQADRTFADVVLSPEVRHSVRGLAASAANTRLHGAPFRHYLFYGPPGTGKTLLAKRVAVTSGLDYAIMSGGDVAPLGAAAVPQLHSLFDWARRSPRGMVLFVDEADAFLTARGSGTASEGMRAAINAMLYRTGDQSRDFMVILATNRPGDLDEAVLDRVDEALEVALPTQPLRETLLRLYFERYVERSAEEGGPGSWGLGALLRGQKSRPDEIKIANFDKERNIRVAAAATDGFSGREIAKLMASVQAAVYGTADATLTPELFDMVLQLKVKQHSMRELLGRRQRAAATGPAGSSGDSVR